MWGIEILTGKSDIIETLRDGMTVLRCGQVYCVDAKEIEIMTLCGFWLSDNITKFRDTAITTLSRKESLDGSALDRPSEVFSKHRFWNVSSKRCSHLPLSG